MSLNGGGGPPFTVRRRTGRSATPRGPGATDYDRLYGRYLTLLRCAAMRRMALSYGFIFLVAWTLAGSFVISAVAANVWWPLVGAAGCLTFAAADLRAVRSAYQAGERAWTLAAISAVDENSATEKNNESGRDDATQEEKGEY